MTAPQAPATRSTLAPASPGDASRAARTLASLALCLALGSCSGIAVKSELDETRMPSSPITYAFAPNEKAPDGEPLRAQIREAVARELEARGLVLASTAEAGITVDFDLSVETDLRVSDPFFESQAAEQEVELGTLAIELVDNASGDRFWRGSATSEIRLAGALIGPFATDWTPTDDPRRWRIADKVKAIFGELAPFPAGGDGPARGDG